jgi:hypothetical protein
LFCISGVEPLGSATTALVCSDHLKKLANEIASHGENEIFKKFNMYQQHYFVVHIIYQDPSMQPLDGLLGYTTIVLVFLESLKRLAI